MTRDWKSEISRRPVLTGILGVAGVAVLGALAYEAPGLLRRRYKPSPFDDLLAQLPDRDNASRVGAAVAAERPLFDADRTAKELRAKLAAISLSQAIEADLSQNRTVEVGGWILPETLANLSALAARAS